MSGDGQNDLLIYGKSIADNQYVKANLEAKYNVRFANALPKVVNFATGHHADLILFELNKDNKKESKTLKRLRALLPEALFLIIMDNKSTKEVAKILKFGATDVFPLPLDSQLLVERVEALLKQSKK